MKLFGSSGSDDSDESEDVPDDETTVTGETYDITTAGREWIGGVEAVTETEAEGVVAGPDVRKILEEGHSNPRKDLWVGYTEDPQEGFREAGIPFDSLFQHLWVAGVSGAGKTTELLNWMIQLAYSGHGFVYFDPKGKDSRELLRKLPEDRLDDVVWIEPGTERDREIGLNLLEVPATDSEVELETAIENRLENLKAALAAKGELHATMESVTESMGRAMMKANADPDAPDYGVIDFYFILLNAERREEFVEECPDPYIREFLEQIAEMDDEQLRPLLKRVKAWVENGVVRRIIARRESTIDWRDLIDEDRIVIVRTPVESTDVKRLTTLAVMRGIWSAVQNRSYETMGDPDPYFVFADEFDDIASEQLDIKSMLARARSMRLSVTAAVQYPSQLSEEVLKPIKNNADNLVTFVANDADDARILTDRFKGYGPEDLIETEKYKVWTRLPTVDGEYSRPLKLSTFAPYPPLRGKDAVEDIIEDSLEQYGDEPLTDEQIQRELPYGGLAESGVDLLTNESTQEDVAKAVHDAALRSDRDDLSIPLEECEDAIRDVLPAHDETRTDSRERLWRNVLQPIPDSMLSESEREGTLWLTVGDETVSSIQDVGDDESAGGGLHSLVLRDVYPALNDLGLNVTIAEQGEGDKSLPDGVADPTPLLEVDSDADPVAIAEALEEFKESHPTVDALTGGREAVLEAEKSTGSTKQGQTVRNLASAFSEGKKSLFLCRDDVADNIWRTLAEEPRGARERHDVSGETRFYNLRPLGIDGERVYRDGAREDVWVRDESTGEIILRDSAGEEHARFPDAESVFEDVNRYPAAGDEATDDMRTIKTPIIPEVEFNGEVPVPGEDWFIVLVPTTGEDETLAVDDLEVYIDGMSVPLSSLGVNDDRDVQDDSDPEPTNKADDDQDDGGTLDKLVGQLD
ncbi:type IV secretory system conjugative DNA transfer family protein [Haloterrigena salifodinae]|uniref:type IV secretory system conjugative DNA transfer family protein n=1 Tax=Haloterrigena salifodinae TaxID=2675099 RepID=UPI000F8869AE|nr:type IV secretory system conjugative DNA transfer family protein [Haloterrigena salifodinae]